MSKNGKTLQEILIEQNEKEKNGRKEKFQLVKEQIGKKAQIVVETVKKHPKKILSGIGALIIVSSIVSCAAKDNNNNNNNNVIGNVQTTTSTTTRPQPTEKEEIVVTTTSTTTTATTRPVETTEPEIIEDETIEVTTVATTTVTEPEVIEDEEIIVTKPATTTANKPVEEQKPAQTTAATTTSTTTATTTTKVEEQKEPVVIEQAESIQIKDFEKKVKLLKEKAEAAGLYVSDEIVENTVRVFHSDFIAHDEFEDLTALDIQRVCDFTANIGSRNCFSFNGAYMGYFPEVTEGYYIPSEICPESNQKFIEAAIKITEAYRLQLNKYGKITYYSPDEVVLTEEEKNIIEQEAKKELGIYYQDAYYEDVDQCNDNYLKDINEYDAELTKLIEQKEEELRLEKYNSDINAQKRAEAYKEYIENIVELINSKDYEKLSQPVKIALFTNIAGGFVSGIQEGYEETFDRIQKNTEDSVYDVFEMMVKANKQNINQQDAADKIVENNTEFVKQEREDLKNIVDELEKLQEEGIILIK